MSFITYLLLPVVSSYFDSSHCCLLAHIELYSFHKLYTQVDHSIDGYSIETPPTEVP